MSDRLPYPHPDNCSACEWGPDLCVFCLLRFNAAEAAARLHEAVSALRSMGGDRRLSAAFDAALAAQEAMESRLRGVMRGMDKPRRPTGPDWIAAAYRDGQAPCPLCRRMKPAEVANHG